MKSLEYALPLSAVLLLLLFFSALPNLKYCALPGDEKLLSSSGCKKERRSEAVFLLLICAVYAFAAFFKLGNTTAPQSFAAMEGRAAIFELNADSSLSKIMLYSGVGTGSYEIEYSENGSTYSPALSFEQDHADVLKWNELTPQSDLKPRFIKISCTSGKPYLGELCFIDSSGKLIPIVSSGMAELCDEQDLCPSYQHFSNSTYFDEIYHARTAWEHLNGIWPYEISHPPLGKIIISAGISLFGMTPFGWRFTGTLSGVLMLPVMYYLLKRLLGGKTVPALGTIVFASDFMHLTQTRIATIDSYAVFFILLMYLFMYGFYEYGSRRDLALSGLFFGLGAASKWTCIYAGAGFAVLWLSYWIRSFITADKAENNGLKAALPYKAFIKNCLFCLVFFVALPCVIYYLSYIPYGISQGIGPFSSKYLEMVLDNQEFMLSYHMNVQAEHPYASRWYQWVLDVRPILYYLQYFNDGTRSTIAAFLNPALCWGGLMSLFVIVYTAVFRRDRKAAFILIGYLTQLVPWIFIKRLTFEYHYFPSSVFLVLALGYVFKLMQQNRQNWLYYAVPFVAVSVVLFIMFYPVLVGLPVNNELASQILGWLPTWPI